MNDNKDDIGNIYHNLSNTIQIKITQQSRENNTLLEQKEREKRIKISSNLSSKSKTNNITQTREDFNFHISNLKNVCTKESNKCKEIDLQDYNENIKNLHSIIEDQKELENSNIFNINNSNIRKLENKSNNNSYNCNKKNNIMQHKEFSSSSGKTNLLKEKYYEFFLNNNKKNKSSYNHKNNKITTTKYNFLTFIPKSLLIQFARLPNVYFLATAIIQSIPLISPLTSVTAIIPLLFVLMVSMVRDLIEDLSRLTYDRINNNEEVIVFRDGKFIKSISSSLNVGEVILIYENKQIPSDMIIIDSNLNDGMAYVETSSLDGEKNLKPKIANNNLKGFFKNKLNYPEEKIENCKIFYGMKIKGFCQCDCPNSDLHKLDGRINISLKISNKKSNYSNFSINNEINDLSFPINQRQMLLKGSILKNTNWIIGFVLYTGMNNKIILNSKMPRTKMSIIEKKMNKYLIGIFLTLMTLCGISSFLHYETYNSHKVFYEKYILLERSIKVESFITFFTYFLLLNTLIPISLIITMEIVKIAQGIFISWDVEMYSKIRHKFAKAKTVSINEELGNVNYIFSDKTGTLTSNKMEFKYCVIYGKCYEYDKNLKESFNSIKENNFTNDEIFSKKNKKSFPIIKIPKNYFGNIIKKIMTPNMSLDNYSQLLDKETQIINEFWTAISITHECVCNKLSEYSGVSPDDVELVKTSYEQGFVFLQSSNDLREIRIGDSIQSFKVLNVLNFSSERKRMSIIIRDKNNIIKLYSKGADCEISKRMSKNSKEDPYSNFTLKCVDKLSCKGFRCLMIAYKIIKEEEYIEWNNKLKSGEMNLAKKAKIVEQCYDIIEQDLELIGATMVEDKLQDKVAETIKDLRMAGIKIWVLTGDKNDTAENIALSCNLISKSQKIFRIFLHHNNYSDRTKNDIFPEISQFFQDYAVFENTYKLKNYIYSNNEQKKDSNNNNNNNNEIKNNNNSENYLSPSHNRKSINHSNINSINNININDGSAINILSQNANSVISNTIGCCNCNFFSTNINTLNKKNSNIHNSNKDVFNHSPFSIIIESSILSGIFKDEEKTKKFLNIAIKASTVICCRVSPLQKSIVVKKIKKFDKNAITLAIGDGGNDVSMIMEAHLGIGIYGEEGMRAVQASDFAIGEFKFLRKLLFFHGRINNNRISKMIIYFFYKNFVFSIIQFVFAFFNMASGQTIIDDWFITFYNLVFTALPLGVQALTDFDVLESDSEQVKKFMPFLYRESREIHPIFSLWRFTFNLIKGFLFAIVIFYLICFSDFGRIINPRGDYGTLWYMSLKTYTNIIFSVSLTLILQVRYITFLFPLIMFTSTFLLYIIFLIIVQYVSYFNSYAVIFHTLSSSQFYFSTLLVCCMSFLADYLIESVTLNFGTGISHNLQRNYFGKKDTLNGMNSLVDKRNMFSKIFQINSNLENRAISKLSEFSMSKTDNYIEESKNHSLIIERTKSVVNINTEKIYYNKRYSEAIGFYNKFKEDNFNFDDKKNKQNLINKKKRNLSLNIKSLEKKVNFPAFDIGS